MNRLAVLLALAACSSEPVFPVDLSPLEPNTADETAPDAPEDTLNVVTGTESDFLFAHAKGRIHAPIRAVWEALKQPDVVVDRRRVSEWTVANDIDPKFAVSFRLHNVVHDLISVEFDSEWRIDVVEGTADAPTVVAARGVKTAGSAFVERIEDSMVLRSVDADHTLVELIRFVGGPTMAEADAERFERDLHASLIAAAHGRALPTWK